MELAQSVISWSDPWSRAPDLWCCMLLMTCNSCNYIEIIHVTCNHSSQMAKEWIFDVCVTCMHSWFIMCWLDDSDSYDLIWYLSFIHQSSVMNQLINRMESWPCHVSCIDGKFPTPDDTFWFPVLWPTKGARPDESSAASLNQQGVNFGGIGEISTQSAQEKSMEKH